jgi:hypothetical protein
MRLRGRIAALATTLVIAAGVVLAAVAAAPQPARAANNGIASAPR